MKFRNTLATLVLVAAVLFVPSAAIANGKKHAATACGVAVHNISMGTGLTWGGVPAQWLYHTQSYYEQPGDCAGIYVRNIVFAGSTTAADMCVNNLPYWPCENYTYIKYSGTYVTIGVADIADPFQIWSKKQVIAGQSIF